MNSAPIGAGPLKRLGKTLNAFADTILKGYSAENATLDPNFPRLLYIQAAHMNWRSQAKKNGLKKRDLYKQY